MVLAAGDVTEFLSIDLTTIIATLLNTLILFLVLRHFLFDKVNKVIEDRKNDVKEYAQSAGISATEWINQAIIEKMQRQDSK